MGWGLKKDLDPEMQEQAGLSRRLRLDCTWTPKDKLKIIFKGIDVQWCVITAFASFFLH